MRDFKSTICNWLLPQNYEYVYEPASNVPVFGRAVTIVLNETVAQVFAAKKREVHKSEVSTLFDKVFFSFKEHVEEHGASLKTVLGTALIFPILRLVERVARVFEFFVKIFINLINEDKDEAWESFKEFGNAVGHLLLAPVEVPLVLVGAPAVIVFNTPSTKFEE